MKKPAPAQQILAEQGYIILAADVSYPLGSMIPLADCGHYIKEVSENTLQAMNQLEKLFEDCSTLKN